MDEVDEGVRGIVARLDDQLARLRSIEPYLIDLSLRENPVGSCIGQTLADKQRIWPQLRAFGFRNILVGTLDYAQPDALEVDDDFMMWLRDHRPRAERADTFAFTDLGLAPEVGSFVPSRSMTK